MANQHAAISLILPDSDNMEACRGLELISLVPRLHADFVGLAGVLKPDSNELWTLTAVKATRTKML